MKDTVRKVPVILQMEALECGAASLAMILAYYKKYIPLEQLRQDCNVSRDGSTAKYIIMAAKHHGLEAKGYKMTVEAIKKEKEFPMIIHWNFNHFVVLCGFKDNKAIINDPAEGTVAIEMEEFDNSFTGVTLKFAVTEKFEPSGKPKSIMTFLKKRMKGSMLILGFIFIIGFIISILELIKPVFYKVFMDKLLIGHSTEWLQMIVTGMIVVLIASFAAEVLRSFLLAKMQAKMSIGASSSFMWHILRLPIEFFSQRFAGDVAARQQSNHLIAEVLCNQMAPVVLNVVMIGIYLVVMVYYNVALAAVGIAMAALNIILLKMVSDKNKNLARALQRDDGKLAGSTIAAVSMIETIKAGGAEAGFFEKIAGYQAKYSNSMVSMQDRNVKISIVPEILSGLSTGIILMLGVYLIFNGEFTIGGLMAFQSFMDLFLSPVGSLIDSVQTFQDISGNIERVEDVLDYETETWKIELPDKNQKYEKLKGNVEIKNLFFAYSPLAPALINDFNLKVKPGQMVALVGGSGSGKSTIAKVVAGLYQPRSGEILFDDIVMQQIDRYIFTSSVAVVDQSIYLFEGTVRDNITMWNTMISEETIIQACKDACIHDDIVKLPDGYDSLILEGGNNFSGGQRQRIEIARAFAVNPSVLIMDEATSALDPLTEKLVMDAVRRRKITCFVIAHRLSAIRDADEIIFLERGVEVERGNHSSLMQQDGRYAALVRNE